MAERDWGAEAGPLADDLEREAEMVVASCLCETCVRSVARLRAAAEGLRLLAEVTAERDDPERRLREVIRDDVQLVLGEWDHCTSVGALAGYNGLTATARATLAHLHGRHDDSPLPTMHCVICAAFRSAAGVSAETGEEPT